ncbi:sphingosine kinase 1 [Procambarus clarkii]|uniref:sphingosine kinase 1 n=1 Tax=Procambarus clarkii TaxID=6728 RepID=UPI00374492CB
MERGRTDDVWSLQDRFRQYKQKGEPYDVRIDETGLTVWRASSGAQGTTQRRVVKVSDLVGCLCMKAGPEEPRSHLAFFTVYAYPLNDTGKRRRLALSFEVDKEDTFEQNLEVANTWRSAVHKAIRSYGTANPQIDKSKRLLLLINPNSGPGKAYQMYKKQVAAVFGEAEVAHDVIVTERANHAMELVKTLDLAKYSGFVIMSGDGLLFEVYNGLLGRSDWKQAIQFPIGIIPGGSGNGLARSLAHWLNEPYMGNPVLVSALNIVHGHLSPLDLAIIQTAEGTKMLSFLSIGFGLISDIDIESERLRRIGEARFFVWSLARIANLRKYNATISFKRIQTKSSNTIHKIRPHLQHSQTVVEPVIASEAMPDSLKRSQSLSTAGENYASFDLSPSLIKVESEESQQNSCTDEGFRQENHHTEIDQNEHSIKENNSEEDNIEAGNDFLMPDINEPVPDDWETVKDNFILVHVSYHSHISSDVFIAPKATPNDGCMWMMMIKGKTPKSTIAKLLLGLDGSHVSIPGVELIAVEALRIVPSTATGCLSVDGELIPWGPVQAHVLPGRGQVMTR